MFYFHQNEDVNLENMNLLFLFYFHFILKPALKESRRKILWNFQKEFRSMDQQAIANKI